MKKNNIYLKSKEKYILILFGQTTKLNKEILTSIRTIMYTRKSAKTKLLVSKTLITKSYSFILQLET